MAEKRLTLAVRGMHDRSRCIPDLEETGNIPSSEVSAIPVVARAASAPGALSVECGMYRLLLTKVKTRVRGVVPYAPLELSSCVPVVSCV